MVVYYWLKVFFLNIIKIIFFKKFYVVCIYESINFYEVIFSKQDFIVIYKVFGCYFFSKWLRELRFDVVSFVYGGYINQVFFLFEISIIYYGVVNFVKLK